MPKALHPIFLACMATAGCHGSASVVETNATVDRQLNDIFANIGEHDGATSPRTPLTADGVGQSMRAAAAQPPKAR